LNAVRDFINSWLQFLGVLAGIVPKTRTLSPLVCRIIHYSVVVLITLVCAWYSMKFESRLQITNSFWFIRKFYLAIQFVLLYLFVRLLIAGVRLFLARDVSEFEDIDRAWYAALDDLARAGYDLQWLPIFVVAGATPEQEKHLFQSARLDWKLNGSAEGPAPLAFYACDEALFISLNGVGAMPLQSQKRGSAQPAPAGKTAGGGAAPPAVQATMRPGQMQAASTATVRPSDRPAVSDTISPSSMAAYGGMTMRPGGAPAAASPQQAEAAPAAGRGLAPARLTADEMRLGRRRMEHFCSRLVEERGAYCPINGVLQVVPLRWSESVAYQDLYAAAQQDVGTLHTALHMQFPVVCLNAGLEETTGVDEFLKRGKQLEGRFALSNAGSRYPSGLTPDATARTWIVERGLNWFRDWVFAEFAHDLGAAENRRLYQFLCALTDRRERFMNALRQVISEAPVSQAVRLSGWYFAATGSDAGRQAFVDGVLRRLMSEQNEVAWTADWRRRDRGLFTLTALLAALTLAVVGADVYLLWQIGERMSSSGM
jgi:uncharacterized membrane protein